MAERAFERYLQNWTWDAIAPKVWAAAGRLPSSGPRSRNRRRVNREGYPGPDCHLPASITTAMSPTIRTSRPA